MTLYKICSNYFDWLKNIAIRGHGKFFYVNIGKTKISYGKGVREASLAVVVDHLTSGIL